MGDPAQEPTNGSADTPRENGSDNPGEDTGDESLPTRQYLGVEVPYVQPCVAHEWWAAESAVFADARSPYAYAQAHITGAVSSPADDRASGERSDRGPRSSTTDRDLLCMSASPLGSPGGNPDRKRIHERRRPRQRVSALDPDLPRMPWSTAAAIPSSSRSRGRSIGITLVRSSRFGSQQLACERSPRIGDTTFGVDRFTSLP
ncbi:MAG: rhodanese-like domain-containing protein [Natrialbaceae archaeon]|nr:rhodanese-like domain-containing protein [Natrialbaceae archaeon]